MKKWKNVIAIGLIAITMLSCATAFGGTVTAYQRTKPKAGEPSRQIRVAALMGDILLGPVAVIVDFVTGAIYVPEKITLYNKVYKK